MGPKMMTFLSDIPKRIGKWYRKRQRQMDIDLLWPQCKAQAPNIDTARWVFYQHASNDPAWFKDFNSNEITDIIDDFT